MADTAGKLTPLLRNAQAPHAVYWSEFALDKKGSAETTFKAPDDPGNWTVKVWAISPDLACGEWHGAFETTTTLDANLSLPAVAVVGDRFQTDITVKNVGSEDDFMALDLIPSGGLSITAEFEKGFPLKADESKQLDPVIIARKAGKQTLSLQLTSASGERKVLKSIQVNGNGASAVGTKQFALFCDETVEPLTLPANAERINWAVGLCFMA